MRGDWLVGAGGNKGGEPPAGLVCKDELGVAAVQEAYVVKRSQAHIPLLTNVAQGVLDTAGKCNAPEKGTWLGIAVTPGVPARSCSAALATEAVLQIARPDLRSKLRALSGSGSCLKLLHLALQTSHLKNTSTGGLCEAQSCNFQLWYLMKSNIIGDRANDDRDFAFLRVTEYQTNS